MTNRDVKVEYLKRIEELLSKLGQDLSSHTVYNCRAGTLTLAESLYGSNSLQVKMLLETFNTSHSPQHLNEFSMGRVGQALIGILNNMKEELEAGLIRNLTREMQGQVIGDFVALAKEQLKDGFKDVSAVLATAALEDAMKRKAEELGLDIEGNSLSEVINALKSKSFFRGAQTSLVPSFVKLRNAALHSEWEKINEAEVNSLIGFLEPFLLENFS